MIENPANKMTLKGLVVKVYGHSGYLTPPILPDVFHLGVWWCICMNTTVFTVSGGSCLSTQPI